MHKRIFYLAVFYIVVSFPCFSQVNLQTGSAAFSIPMFNWQDNKSSLNSVVALSYSSGNGVKVNSLASNVGEGWNLITGGVISRMQVGEPDDQKGRDGADLDISRYPSGYLYATVPAANGCPLALTRYPIYPSMNQVYKQHNVIAEDKQLDYFSFQFNGKSGVFIIDPTQGDIGVSLGDSKLKITFQRDETMAASYGIRTTITSFTVQDIDGLIYRFSEHGLSKVLKSNYCDANLTESQTQPKFKNDKVYHQSGFDKEVINPWVINSWYLKEIEDPLTHRKVTFTYQDRVGTAKAGEDINYNEGDKHYCIITHRFSKYQSREISSISYPDGHVVNFNYSPTQRFDFSGQYAMSSIDVLYNGRSISKYVLNTTYFILNRYGTPISNFQKKAARLCLRSVQKIGVDLKEENLPYIFDYYTGSDAPDDFVPPPFFYARDTWGFYNGQNSKDDGGNPLPLNLNISQLSYQGLKGLCFLRQAGSNEVFNYYNTKDGYAKNGLLRQIIYPTGGTLSYQYVQNTYPLNGNPVSIGGVHVSQTATTDGGFSNGCTNPIITNYNYVTSNGTSSLWGFEEPKTSQTTENYYKPVGKYYHWTISCAPAGLHLAFPISGYPFPGAIS